MRLHARLLVCVLGLGLAGLVLRVAWGPRAAGAPARLYLLPATADANASPLAVGSEAATAYLASLRDRPLGLTVITHGWIERETWCEDLARALRARATEPWLYGWLDWRAQSRDLNPTHTAALARDRLGPELGRVIAALDLPLRHVHLVGHSAGSWLINEAARTLARDPGLSLHLTFLDAYVPPGWDDNDLGDSVADPEATVWCDQYFTRDHTLGLTHHALSHAVNVELTAIAHGLNRHRFPIYWYQATVSGRYPRALYAERPVISHCGDLNLGFALSREAGPANWQRARGLTPGGPALIVRRGDGGE